jgi:hypothetical protein
MEKDYILFGLVDLLCIKFHAVQLSVDIPLKVVRCELLQLSSHMFCASYITCYTSNGRLQIRTQFLMMFRFAN